MFQSFSSLEMVDKIDPPPIPEGYGLSVAFLCLLDVVRCVQGLIESSMVPQPEVKTAEDDTVKKGLSHCSYCVQYE